MRIVFPEGSGCVQKPEDLAPVQKLGTVDYYEKPPENKADLIQRLRDADVVFLDYSVMDADVIAACPKLKFICFFGIGYGNCIDVAAATRHGVPTGMQFLGRPYEENAIIAAAGGYQTLTDWHLRHPPGTLS